MAKCDIMAEPLALFYKLTFYQRLEKWHARWNRYENSDLLIFVGLFLSYTLIY